MYAIHFALMAGFGIQADIAFLHVRLLLFMCLMRLWVTRSSLQNGHREGEGKEKVWAALQI